MERAHGFGKTYSVNSGYNLSMVSKVKQILICVSFFCCRVEHTFAFWKIVTYMYQTNFDNNSEL